MTKIKAGDIVEYKGDKTNWPPYNQRQGIVMRRSNIWGKEDSKGRYFCVFIFHTEVEITFKINELNLLTG